MKPAHPWSPKMTLSPAQLRDCAAAMLALADGKPVQYFSTINGWSDCQTIDTEFWHRPKPEEEISTNVEEY